MKEDMKVNFDWKPDTRFYNISTQKCSDTILRVIWKNNAEYTRVFFNAYKTSTDYGACCLITPYLDFENPKLVGVNPQFYTGQDYLDIPKGLTRNGIKNGLNIMLDVENYDYSYFERGAKGFRVAIGNYDQF